MKNKRLKAGFGRTDITPELGVRLGGYGVKERPAEEILDNLHCTAVVLEQNDTHAALLNLDWICAEERLVNKLRSEINKKVPIPPENITVCTTHSHSVPNTLNFWGWGDMEHEYVDKVTPAIVSAVERAQANLRPVSTGFATTESLVGVNRRGVNEDGGLGGFMGSPQDPFDPTMTVAHFKNDKEDAGIIVHYGAHCTAMGNNRIVSRDWCGVMKDRVESQFGVPVFFINGAIGDVGPRTNIRTGAGLSAGGGDGIHAVREVGYRGATDAIRALISIKEWRSELGLKLESDTLQLPYAPLPSKEEAEKEVEKWEPQKDEWGTPMCLYKHNKAVLEALETEPVSAHQFPQTLTAIGPLAIVPMPGEMFAGISLRIRTDSPFQHTLCCSVSNGALGYLPTREARHRGGYETWVGKAVSPYLLADNIDDVLVRQNLELLRRLAGNGKR